VSSALREVETQALTRQVRALEGEVEDLEVAAPRGRLDRVLLNLLENAIRFNRPGGAVWVEASKGEANRVRIVVRDTGIGIPSEDQPRIFERFYCVDRSRSRETGGIGLGLAIVKHIVENLSGTVSVQSRLGEGSAFTVVLPAA